MKGCGHHGGVEEFAPYGTDSLFSGRIVTLSCLTLPSNFDPTGQIHQFERNLGISKLIICSQQICGVAHEIRKLSPARHPLKRSMLIAQSTWCWSSILPIHMAVEAEDGNWLMMGRWGLLGNRRCKSVEPLTLLISLPFKWGWGRRKKSNQY